MVKRISLLLCAMPLLALIPRVCAEERVDLGTLHQIKEEAFQNSKVMDTMFYLTDVNGPRVTNSPGYFAAADWVVKQLQELGHGKSSREVGPVRPRMDLYALFRDISSSRNMRRSSAIRKPGLRRPTVR